MGLGWDDWNLDWGTLGIDSERRSLPNPVDNDQEFMDFVVAPLERLARTQVGRRVKNGIRPYAVVTSMFNYDNDYPRDTQDIDGLPAFTIAANEVRATAPGLTVRPSDGLVGTGGGSWALIYVNPAECRASATQVDAILVHELTHAMRMTSGVYSRQAVRPVPNTTAGYTNSEERIAQVLMNMYFAETRQGGYMLGYGADWVDGQLWEPPMPGRPTDARYAEQARYELRAIEEFAHRSPWMKSVFEGLARCDYDGYNPFRAWVRGTNPAVIVPRGWRRAVR